MTPGFAEDGGVGGAGEVTINVVSTVGDKTEAAQKVAAGTTAGDWFQNYLKGRDPANYQIYVNGNKVSRTYVFKGDEEVVVMQSKIAAGFIG